MGRGGRGAAGAQGAVPCPVPISRGLYLHSLPPPSSQTDAVQLLTPFDNKLTLSRADTRLLELGRMVVGVEPSPIHSVTIAALCRSVPVGGLNPAAPGLLTRNERLQFLRVCATVCLPVDLVSFLTHSKPPLTHRFGVPTL